MFIRLLALLCMLLALALPAQAEEEILSFDSQVKVMADGALLVRETIRVRAQGRRIRRGIYRDFPLLFRYPDGSTGQVGFEVLEVLRNGKPENWFEKRPQAGMVRIYIGRKDVSIPAGEHVYAITYRTTRQLRFFREHDELYWNVTGNFWAFPIREAKVEVVLPRPVRIIRHAVYTGSAGEKGTYARVEHAGAGRFVARTTRPLWPGEGFTIAIAFPKGVVKEPGMIKRLAWRILDMSGLWWFLAGMLGLGGYLYANWRKHGRDPAPGVIIPRWEPPAGISPAIAGQFLQEALERETDPQLPFIAALLSLGHKGYLSITQDDKNIMTLTRRKHGDESLPPGERVIMDKLLGAATTLRLDRQAGEQLQKTMMAFNKAIGREYKDSLLIGNERFFIMSLLGYGALLLSLGLLAFLGVPLAREMVLASLVVAIPAALLAGFGLDMFVASKVRGKRWHGNLLPLLIVLPFAGVAAYVAAMMLSARFLPMPWLVGIVALLFCAPMMLVVFRVLMRRPTRAGRQVLDHLAGMRLFMETAERRLLGVDKTDDGQKWPEMSQVLYERLLPWAVALGLEETWTSAFHKWLARTRSEDVAMRTGPDWMYRSSATSSRHMSNQSIASSLAGSLSAAMPSHSSSGSGGGGSSGGGGGGGGGGGW